MTHWAAIYRADSRTRDAPFSAGGITLARDDERRAATDKTRIRTVTMSSPSARDWSSALQATVTDEKEAQMSETPEPDAPERPVTIAERLQARVTHAVKRAAPYVVTIDGFLLILVGIYAIVGALNTVHGEGFLLVVGGLALILFGIMVIMRWNPQAVRTGLIGLTAGYFASALSEFEVATDPCDIGSTIARCAGEATVGTPWIVYQGPLILAMLLFIFIAFERRLEPTTAPAPTES